MTLANILDPVRRNTSFLSLTNWKLYVFSAFFAIGNLTLPMAVHSIPQGGQIFLPLFFFTLVAAWQFGWAAGLLVAVASPLLNFGLTGMPTLAMLPVVLGKSVALAVIAAWLSQRSKAISLPGIALAIILMQAIGLGLGALSGMPWAINLLQLRLAIPGMLIMLVLGYAVLRLLNRVVPNANRDDKA